MSNFIKALMLIFLITSLMTCKTKLHRYESKSTFPKAVYVDDQIKKIWPKIKSLKGKSRYLEIRKRNGIQETGEFVRISEDTLVLCRGFYYKSVKDSLIKIVQVVPIPKNDIIIMKIY